MAVHSLHFSIYFICRPLVKKKKHPKKKEKEKKRRCLIANLNQRSGHFLTVGPGRTDNQPNEPQLDCSQNWAETTQTLVFLTCGESVIGIWETSARVRKERWKHIYLED